MARLFPLVRLLAPATLVLLTTGCGSSPSGDADSKTVHWAFILPTSWDPVTSRTGADINTVSLAYASLTRLDREGKVEPALAKSWHYDKGGTAITFVLRDGLKFTDGTPLDAAAVKAFFDRAQSQKDSFLKDQLAAIATTTADSKTEVTLHLNKPDYQIPYLLAGRTGAIASPAAARKDLAKLSLWAVGAGPFKLVEFIPESRATFVRNPDYWDASNIHIDRLVLTKAPDPSTLVAAVSSGAVDFAAISPKRVREAKTAGLNITTAPNLSAQAVSINLNKAPFTNPKVVEAFRYAFNRQEFVDVLTDGVGTVTHQPFPKGYFAFNPEVEKLWNYDPERAKALLREAGYPPGRLSITITAGSFGTSNTPELVQGQLARIGVKSTIKIIPSGSSSWQAKVYVAKEPQFATDGTIGRESPTQSLLASYGPTGIMNLSGPHASKAFLDALDTANATPPDDPKFQRRLWDAVRLGVEQSPTNYLYSSRWTIVTSPRVRHPNITPSQIRWEGVTLE